MNTLLAHGFAFLLFAFCTFCVGATISKEPLEEIPSHSEGRETRQSCSIAAFILDGGISRNCTNAITSSTPNIKLAICSRACDSLYSAYVKCAGASVTQVFYKSYCTNGYQQGPATASGGTTITAIVHYSVVGICLVTAAALLIWVIQSVDCQ